MLAHQLTSRPANWTVKNMTMADTPTPADKAAERTKLYYERVDAVVSADTPSGQRPNAMARGTYGLTLDQKAR